MTTDPLLRAIALAARGGRVTAPNPRVGAVVVADGAVVGEGWHERAGGAHAEALALSAAGARARGATLYVSLEPCSHEGRTPPCTSAIAEAGVRRVVVGLVDPDARVSGRGLDALRAAGIEVSLADGAAAREASAVIEDYLVHRAEGRSFAALKVAGTLDGRIADAEGLSRWVTGAPARAHGRALRERYGAILVGAGTVLADDPLLLPPGEDDGAPFTRVILDRRLRTPPGARLLAGGASGSRPVLIFAAPDADRGRRRRLEQAGAEIVAPGPPGEPVPPRDVLADLARRGILGAVIEGGGGVHGAFLDAGLVDKAYWYLAPALLGDSRAVPAVRGGERPLAAAWRARIANLERLGDDVLLTLYPRGPQDACSQGS